MKYFKANILWFFAFNTGVVMANVDGVIWQLLVAFISLGGFMGVYYCWILKEDKEKT